ncbi:MAG: murein biosynthesis integral membrane protein MurJ [Alphaproteobacteria bacterium]|nr:murein biosynthesis integral membrane protein MurJ [Alphaproteobacteria bacterium]
MHFARALFTVSSLTMGSRVAGFIRDVVTAALLGAGPMADAFFVAQRLPNLFRNLFAEGAFNASFVPLYTSEQQKNGASQAQHFAGEALAMMLLILIPFTAIVIFGMPWIMYGLAPGFADDPEKYHLAVSFSQITFPYLLLISLTALQTGVLNADGKFAPGAAAPILFNIIMVIGLFMAALFGWHPGYTLAISVTIAGAVQCVWLWAFCRRYKTFIPLLWPQLSQRVRLLFKRIGPGALGAGAAQINLLVSTILASLLPSGAVSYLFYADRLNSLPQGVIGVAVATALLPILSRHVEAGNEGAARHYFSRGIEISLAIGLPAAIGLMLAAEPIIRTLFEHGAFSADDTRGTSQALMAYAIGIPAFLLVKVLSASLFARHDTATPVKVAIVAVISNIVLTLLLLEPLQHVGIALANGIATWINAVLLYYFLHKSGRVLADEQLKKRLPRLVLCSAILAGIVYGLDFLLADYFVADKLMQEVVALTVLLGVSVLAFAALVQATGAWRWQDMVTILRRKSDSPAADSDNLPPA